MISTKTIRAGERSEISQNICCHKVILDDKWFSIDVPEQKPKNFLTNAPEKGWICYGVGNISFPKLTPGI